MNRFSLIVCCVVCGAAGFVLASRRAESGQADSIVRLQQSSPGTQQIGNANLSGTVKMGGLQLGNSATPGQVMTADSNGVGTWQDPNSGPQAVRVYRWNVFETYEQAVGWTMNNDSSLFGGVPPSTWTDGNATANMISSDHNVQRALFSQRGTFGSNAMVYSATFLQFSSTTGRVVVCMFRVHNTTPKPIAWTPIFRYTCYSAWGEMASCAINGSLAWSAANSGLASVPLSIPGSGTSTVIFVASSGLPQSTGGNPVARSTQLGFVNDSLNLPVGLEFVDDLDSLP